MGVVDGRVVRIRRIFIIFTTTVGLERQVSRLVRRRMLPLLRVGRVKRRGRRRRIEVLQEVIGVVVDAVVAEAEAVVEVDAKLHPLLLPNFSLLQFFPCLCRQPPVILHFAVDINAAIFNQLFPYPVFDS